MFEPVRARLKRLRPLKSRKSQPPLLYPAGLQEPSPTPILPSQHDGIVSFRGEREADSPGPRLRRRAPTVLAPRHSGKISLSLRISGERKLEEEEKSKKYHRIERWYGSFERSFTLPDGTKPEALTAEYKDGVLKVHLPKSETAKPKQVEIKVN
jgi:hypothetical protein